jgi:hypothetical protein
MKLYIQVENGQTINHPALEDNLMQAFNQIPTYWETFVRVERPTPSVYQMLDSETPTYEKIDGVWTDVWAIRNMTAEEKAAKQQATIDAFNAQDQAENWSAWALDEATCTMQPPTPRPDPIDGVLVFWCGADNAWKEAPAQPVDGGQYKFNFVAWNWVAV